jgi:hypothetical protein
VPTPTGTYVLLREGPTTVPQNILGTRAQAAHQQRRHRADLTQAPKQRFYVSGRMGSSSR